MTIDMVNIGYRLGIAEHGHLTHARGVGAEGAKPLYGYTYGQYGQSSHASQVAGLHNVSAYDTLYTVLYDFLNK